jgi:hypothetical protein
MCARHELSVPPSGDAKENGSASGDDDAPAPASRFTALASSYAARSAPRAAAAAAARDASTAAPSRAREASSSSSGETPATGRETPSPPSPPSPPLARVSRAFRRLAGRKRGVRDAFGAYSGDGGVVLFEVGVCRVRGSQQALLRHNLRGFVPDEHSPDAIARGFELARKTFASERGARRRRSS